MATQRQVRLDPLLERDYPQLLEPRDLRLRERLVREVGESRAAPERESVGQHGARGRGIAQAEQLATVADELREAVDVDVRELELEDVAGGAGRKDVAEHLAKLRDIHLDCVGCRLGLFPRPEALDEPVAGDDPAGLEGEHGEQRPRLRAADSDVLAAQPRLERAEEPHLELPALGPLRSAHVCVRSFSRSHGRCPFRPNGLSVS